MIALGDVIEATVSSLFPAAPSPETLTQFTETVMELLDHASTVLGTRDLPGGDVLRHCMAQVTTILSHLQAVSGLSRAEQLSVSLVEQYEAGRILGTRLHELPQQEHDSGHDPTQRVKADTVASENTTEGQHRPRNRPMTKVPPRPQRGSRQVGA